MRHLASVVALLVVFGCVPTRDNPDDPALAFPVVMLDAGAQRGGQCPADPFDAGDAFPDPLVVASAFRGHCLYLDAREGLRSGSTVRVLVHATSLAAPILLVEESPALFPVPPNVLSVLPVDRTIEFEVRGTRADGRVAAGRLSFVVRNHAPAVGLDGARTLPRGGYPWRRGLDPAFLVTFAATPSDPDGDAIVRYAWSFPPDDTGMGQLVTTTTGSSSISRYFRTDPVGDRTHVVGVRAYDGNQWSAKTNTTVTIARPNLWTQAASAIADPTFELVDDRRLQLTCPGGEALRVVVLAAGRIAALCDFSGNHELVVYDPDAPLIVIDSAPIPGLLSGSVLAINAERTRVWAVIGRSDTSADAFAWDVDSAGMLTAVPSSGVPVPVRAISQDVRPFVAVDGSGSLWLSSARFAAFDSSLDLVTAGGSTPVVVEDTQTRFLVGLGRRPESAEMWSVWVSGLFDGEVQVRRHEASGEETIFEVGSSGGFAAGPAWINDDEAWLFVPGRGLVKFDATTLEITGSFDEAALLTAGGSEASVLTSRLLADPSSQSVWLPSTGGIERITSEGQSYSYAESVTPLDVDDAGSLWFIGDESMMFRGRSPSAKAVGIRASVTPFYERPASYDWMTGGIWLARQLPYGLSHVSQDGTVSERAVVVTIDGAVPTAWPSIFAQRMGLDGRMWALTGDANGLVLLDVAGARTDPEYVIPGTRILSDPQAKLLVSAAMKIDPVSPVNAIVLAPGVGFAWALLDAGGGDSWIAKVPDQPTVLTAANLVYDVPLREESTVRAAVSAATGRLCVASLDTNGSATLFVRSIDPANGQATLVGNVPVAADEVLVDVGASWTAPGGFGDGCWALTLTPPGGTPGCGNNGLSHIYGFSVDTPTPAAPFRLHNENGAARSMRVVDQDTLWIVNDPCPELDPPPSKVRFNFSAFTDATPGVMFTPDRDDVFVP